MLLVKRYDRSIVVHKKLYNRCVHADVPHSMQNFDPTEIGAWQFEHVSVDF